MRRVRKGAGLNARQRRGLESDIYDGEEADDSRARFLDEVAADDDDAIVGTDEEIDSEEEEVEGLGGAGARRGRREEVADDESVDDDEDGDAYVDLSSMLNDYRPEALYFPVVGLAFKVLFSAKLSSS